MNEALSIPLPYALDEVFTCANKNIESLTVLGDHSTILSMTNFANALILVVWQR